MARDGQNPLKWIDIKEKPAKITVTSIVHLPELDGFWENGMEVLDKFFHSIRNNTEQNFDLMILDNGSCKEVRDYLYDLYNKNQIQFLIYSKYNLRKLGGMNLLFSYAQGEIISFTDSDVYFLPGWLDDTLNIFKEFPQAGMVSAIPTIDQSEKRMESTFRGIKNSNDIIMQTGNNLIPDKFIETHRRSLGKSKEDFYKGIKNRKDKKISRNGINAYVSAQDFQFTTTKKIINKITPLEMRSNDEFYDPLYSPVFETKLNELGYWRLSTSRYLIHHMGNNISQLDEEISFILDGQESLPVNIKNLRGQKQISLTKRITLNKHFRKLLKYIYSKIYRLLYEI